MCFGLEISKIILCISIYILQKDMNNMNTNCVQAVVHVVVVGDGGSDNVCVRGKNCICGWG